MSFKVYGDEEGDERIIPVDCVPRVLPGDEWRQLELGLTQRLKALNLFLADVYGPARIVKDGVIPVEVVRGCPQYRVEMRGLEAPHGVWVAICGTDLVRTNEGFKVLEDNLRVPLGVAYMLANRKAVKASFRRLYRSSRVQDIEHYGRVLLTTLQELAPGGKSDPSIALVTPGVYNSAFYEHMFLAREIGAELVEGRDLLVDDGVVYMRTTAGLRRVDLVYRRIDDFLDPVVFREDFVYWDYTRPSAPTGSSPALTSFVDLLDIRARGDPLESLLRLSDTLHRAFTYSPGSTSVISTIDHILETGQGVCQDYAHVMIAIARCWGIPTRYVSGYLHVTGNGGQQVPATSSHAWVECRLPDLGWVCFDPTNQTLVDERYVRVAVGRDYQDVPPTRGIVHGGGQSRLQVNVHMRPLTFPEARSSAGGRR